MPAYVAMLVLLSAWMHAGWNILVKGSKDAQLDTLNFALAGSVVALLALPFVALPDKACIPWMASSLLIHVAYFVSLVEAYRHTDLSVAYPLMRGMAPVLVTLLAPLAGELITPQQVLGIVVIAVGIALPTWAGMGWKTGSRKGLHFGMLNAVIIALYTLLDGIGVRLSGTAVGYTFWMFFLNGWGILIVTLYRRGYQSVWRSMKVRWRIALIGALLSISSYGIVLWAMSVAPIPAVAALREVSVIFAAIMGVFWLHERMGHTKIVGALFVALGAVVLRTA